MSTILIVSPMLLSNLICIVTSVHTLFKSQDPETKGSALQVLIAHIIAITYFAYCMIKPATLANNPATIMTMSLLVVSTLFPALSFSKEDLEPGLVLVFANILIILGGVIILRYF